MTDITELAQSLKAAAENAIGAHERLAAYPYGEIIDISQQEGEQIDIDITDINEFLEEASPANILALVDALEKAQQQNISDFEIKARLCKESNSLHDRLREADKRIAELESRTVKLPHRNLGHDKLFLLCPFPYYDAEDMEKALAAAGIKVEAE
ncbi:ead/Ea22-like family protein [Klebsiella pneumoniae]|uniref:Ead/Ea22-like family protein n=3 Tax=Klebsiella pneumoniae TaxID=573 RepID=A0A9Q4YK79_KLEPN|nr:ead/Ea22-like family protein [Klebsiella pneumoniae]HDU4475159.1 ead/Ea22-like family protein [Klebsiella pneumoniae subsp. ozaenae]EKS2174533.1 ead/Ea22-like family protein [Klebsiella pneumoniae]EKW5278334.1 ead/Ea22-like family protein [Klebsiella pneumoniae]ELA0131270.1 ead/Ea22-like family protein [Klebsiella pneumoniae]ELA2119829.1 ead/Ea22-like family protein [Klebsiella pneumoniae]